MDKYFDLLKAPPTASSDEIERAYKRAVRRCSLSNRNDAFRQAALLREARDELLAYRKALEKTNSDAAFLGKRSSGNVEADSSNVSGVHSAHPAPNSPAHSSAKLPARLASRRPTILSANEQKPATLLIVISVGLGLVVLFSVAAGSMLWRTLSVDTEMRSLGRLSSDTAQQQANGPTADNLYRESNTKQTPLDSAAEPKLSASNPFVSQPRLEENSFERLGTEPAVENTSKPRGNTGETTPSHLIQRADSNVPKQVLSAVKPSATRTTWAFEQRPPVDPPPLEEHEILERAISRGFSRETAAMKKLDPEGECQAAKDLAIGWLRSASKEKFANREFTFLRLAWKHAVISLDIDLAIEILDLLSQRFNVGRDKILLRGLSEWKTRVRRRFESAEDRIPITSQLSDLSINLVSRYESPTSEQAHFVLEAIELALFFAEQSSRGNEEARLARAAIDLRRRCKNLEKLDELLSELARDFNDPQKCQAAGQILCFQEGDWSRGLEFLANGEHRKLASCAELELNKTPNSNANQNELAGAWLNAADELNNIFASQGAYRRALHWYSTGTSSTPTKLTEMNIKYAERQAELMGSLIDHFPSAERLHPYVFVVNSLRMPFARIPLNVGALPQKRDISTDRSILVSNFEVTQKHYQMVMHSTQEVNSPNAPITQITREEAIEFCRRLSAMPAERRKGRSYRLPRSDEWDLMALGELSRKEFLDDVKKLRQFAWTYENSLGRPVSVGSLRPNQYGLFDICGNVWEWCESQSATEDMIAAKCRGGGYYTPATDCLTNKKGIDPTMRYADVGFRVVLELAPLK